MVSRERVLELLDYDPETGIFTWRVRRSGVKFGSHAGRSSSSGYREIRIDGRRYSAHRLVWLVVHGTWPHDQIDHINGIRDDNRANNLREATRTENQRNSKIRVDNTIGYKGVTYHKASRKFRAQCQDHNGIRMHLGLFSTVLEAAKAYDAFARTTYGEFARLNFPDVIY